MTDSAPRLRVAVIGCGDVSVVHFAAIASAPDAELVAVCDTDAGRLKAAGSATGVATFDDCADLLATIKPDVVHICTPHDTHAELAIAALDANVNVLLEKPLAHSRAEAERLIEAARRSAAKIAVCFQNRYNRPVQAAHELLASGSLGAVLGGSATVMWQRSAGYYRDRPWRGRWATGGGGLLMNQAIHTLDLLQWLIGDVARVSGGASTRYLNDVIEVEDTADMVLWHENGARSVFYATLADVVNEPITVDVVTERAILSLRGALTVRHADGRVQTVHEADAPAGGRAYWGASHELLIHDFYSSLAAGQSFWIDGPAAIKSLDIIQSVYDQSDQYGALRPGAAAVSSAAV